MTASKRRRESVVERWCVRWARARGWVVSKLTDPTGIPDHVFWAPGGRPLIVEFKDPNGRTSKGREALQAYYRRLLGKHQYLVFVFTTKEEFLNQAERYL